MTYALIWATNGYCRHINKCDQIVSAKTIAFGHLVFDVIASIIPLVIGILGAVGVIGMPPAAAYTMIAIGSTILVADVMIIAFDHLKRRCQGQNN